MTAFFHSGGTVRWFLFLTAGIILTLFVKNMLALLQGNKDRIVELDDRIHTILFWGVVSVVLGFFAHYYGLYNALKAISKAQTISHTNIASGYAISITPILFGLFVFIVSLLFWIVLRWRFNKYTR